MTTTTHPFVQPIASAHVGEEPSSEWVPALLLFGGTAAVLALVVLMEHERKNPPKFDPRYDLPPLE